MALSDWFRTEFELLETRAAMAEDTNAALVDLIAKVKSEKSTMAASEWRRQVDAHLRYARARTPGSAGGRRSVAADRAEPNATQKAALHRGRHCRSERSFGQAVRMPDHTLPAPIAASTTVALTAADETAVHGFALAEKSAATRRAYRSDFAIFSTWCEGRGSCRCRRRRRWSPRSWPTRPRPGSARPH